MHAGCTDLRAEQRQLAADFGRQRWQKRRRAVVKPRIRHDRVAHVLHMTNRRVRIQPSVVLHLPCCQIVRSRACLRGKVGQLRQRFCSQGIQQLCARLPVCMKHTIGSGSTSQIAFTAVLADVIILL